MDKEISQDTKTTCLRMPKDLWLFLRSTAYDNEVTITSVIIECLEKYKKKIEKKLTQV